MRNDALVNELALKLGDQVCVAGEDIMDDTGLFPDEASIVERAVPKRRAEFAAGRRAARQALQDLGVEANALLRSESRAPLWPQGVVGSIAHDQGLALATVAKDTHIRALGIDVTESAPLPGATRDSICTNEEQVLSALESRAAFAIKECLFKALHPLIHDFFGFDAAIASPDFSNQTFEVRLTRDLGPFPGATKFDGVLLHMQGMIVASLAVPRL